METESNKISCIFLPAALIVFMHSSECLLLDTTLPARVELLLQDYRHLIDHPEQLLEKLQVLLPFHSHQRLEHWSDLIQAEDFAALVSELLVQHYDPPD